MAIADRCRVPVEPDAADAAHAGHQLDAEEPTQAKDRSCMRVHAASILYQPAHLSDASKPTHYIGAAAILLA